MAASVPLLLPAAEPAQSPTAAERIEQLEIELRQARAEGAAAAQRLHRVAGHLREGLLLLDENLHVSLINDQCCRLLELPLPATQWLGAPMETLVTLVLERVADPASYFAELAEARGFPVSQLDALLPLRSGRVLERNIVAVEMGTGTGWLLSYRDVTAVRQGEAQLRLVSRLPEENPNPIARLDAGGRTLYRNPAALKAWQNVPEALRVPMQNQLQAVAAASLASGQRQELELRIGARDYSAFVVPVPTEHHVNLYLVDVTAARQADAECDAQRKFYETILDELPVEVVVLDDQRRYVYANPQAEPEPAHRAWLLGRTVREYCQHFNFPLALAEQRGRMFEQAETSRELVVWDDCTPRPGGNQYHQRHFKLLAGAAAHGRPFMLGYGLDVTARVLAEERSLRSEAALREQQEFTQQVLDTNPNAIYVRDATGRLVFGNRAMQQLVELSRAAQHTPRLRPRKGEEAAQYAAADAQVLASGQEVVSEDPLTLSTGEVRWFYSVKRPLLRPDGTVQVLGVSTEITALKQAQHTLERNEKKYRDLMHYAQALICTYDSHGTVLSVNPALAAVLARPVEALMGQPVATFLLAEDQTNFTEYLSRILVEGEARGVLRVQPHGSPEGRHLLYHNFVMREPDQPSYIISHAHDITERILAEQATQRARDEAEATARARENFLANMSHEIRTPMNGVLGMTAQLAKTHLDPRQQELMRIIRSSGQHLLTVLNDVLDMAKITAGKMELEATAFNLCDSVNEALEPLIAQAQEKGLAFDGMALRESCPLPWVVGDPHRLNQVLLNLVSNAVKFTARGRIGVRSELLAETAEALTVRFGVTDTGPGIAPDKQAYLFESFTQAYADTTRRHGGTGLGLSISRALVEQMGGQLTLDSALGQGSTFAFALTLPKSVAAEPAATDAPAPFDTGRLAGARVLLVEDNEINRAVARFMLEPWGVQLAEAVDGPAALALLAAHDYDLVLMDIQMPGLSGLDVTQRLRLHPNLRRAQTPVIALTANAFRADVERYLAAGFNDCLTKPYDEATLYQKMDALLPPAVSAPSVSASAPAYDLAPMRQLAQGREEFVAKIIRSFLANMPGSLAQLRAAATAGSWPEVARLVHHIKPNLLALGVADVEAPLALLEQKHQAAAAATLHPALAQLLASVERALQALPTELPA